MQAVNCGLGLQDMYAELSEQCKSYACGLLDQCRSTEEVIAVLNKSSDDDEIDWEDITLDRLKMAIKYEQKQVRQYAGTSPCVLRSTRGVGALYIHRLNSIDNYVTIDLLNMEKRCRIFADPLIEHNHSVMIV